MYLIASICNASDVMWIMKGERESTLFYKSTASSIVDSFEIMDENLQTLFFDIVFQELSIYSLCKNTLFSF